MVSQKFIKLKKWVNVPVATVFESTMHHSQAIGALSYGDQVTMIERRWEWALMAKEYKNGGTCIGWVKIADLTDNLALAQVG